MIYIFFGCTFLITYHYIFYPLLLALLSVSKRHKLQQDDFFPSVTFIIAAYNEEKIIVDKMKNTLNIDYPEEKLDIIVISDGSTDSTADLMKQFSSTINKTKIISLYEKERKGKTAALNRAVPYAQNEIIVFSDANNFFNGDALKKLVRHFGDQTIGGACGLKYILSAEDRQASAGDSLYWKYESRIKSLESNINSIAGADGEIFAMRKSLYKKVAEDIINDDAAITFDIVKQNYRVIYDTEAIAKEYASISLTDDFFVKVRMVAGGFQTIRNEWRYLFSFSSLFAFQFISHKVLRWFIPYFLIMLIISNAFLLEIFTLKVFFILQLLFYISAGLGFLLHWSQSKRNIFYIPFYFVLMNIAAIYGCWRFLTGSQTKNWRKAAR